MSTLYRRVSQVSVQAQVGGPLRIGRVSRSLIWIIRIVMFRVSGAPPRVNKIAGRARAHNSPFIRRGQWHLSNCVVIAINAIILLLFNWVFVSVWFLFRAGSKNWHTAELHGKSRRIKRDLNAGKRFSLTWLSIKPLSTHQWTHQRCEIANSDTN